jgi:hypothetical protein
LLLDRYFNQQPVQSFPKPEKRPGAVSKKRWEPLTAEEQAFVARVEEEMKLRGYSPKTRKTYRNHLLRFSRHFVDRSPLDIGEKEIRAYLLSLIEREVSTTSSLPPDNCWTTKPCGTGIPSIQANRIHAIRRRPKMVTPIGLLLQIRELLKYPNRSPSFHRAQQVGNGYLGRDHYNQVNVLLLNV